MGHSAKCPFAKVHYCAYDRHRAGQHSTVCLFVKTGVWTFLKRFIRMSPFLIRRKIISKFGAGTWGHLRENWSRGPGPARQRRRARASTSGGVPRRGEGHWAPGATPGPGGRRSPLPARRAECAELRRPAAVTTAHLAAVEVARQRGRGDR